MFRDDDDTSESAGRADATRRSTATEFRSDADQRTPTARPQLSQNCEKTALGRGDGPTRPAGRCRSRSGAPKPQGRGLLVGHSFSKAPSSPAGKTHGRGGTVRFRDKFGDLAADRMPGAKKSGACHVVYAGSYIAETGCPARVLCQMKCSSRVCEFRQRTTYLISSDYSELAARMFLNESFTSFIGISMLAFGGQKCPRPGA